MSPEAFNRYRFASEDSRAAALAAIDAVKDKRRSAFVVIGPTASGKTRFVHECLSQAFPAPAITPEILPRVWRRGAGRRDSSRAMHRKLENVFAVALNRGYLWIEECREVRLDSPELLAFITSDRYSYRKFRSTEIVTLANNCPVFIAGCNLSLCDDIRARARVIEFRTSHTLYGGEVAK